MTWSNLRFNVWRSFVTMATNLPSCFSIEFVEQLLKFLANFTLLKYVKSQRSYRFLIRKELIFWFPNFGYKRSLLNLLNCFSSFLRKTFQSFLFGTHIELITYTEYWNQKGKES